MSQDGDEEVASMGYVKRIIRKRIRRQPQHEATELNIYPLMDVMTILLVFMIMQFAQESAAIVQGPTLQIPWSTARTEPAAVAGLRVLAWSAPAPGLPYVTRADAGEDELAALRAGLLAAAADPELAAARRALSLTGFEVLPLAAYDAIDEMEAEAIALGYPEII